MENSTGNADKKYTTGKNDKTEEKRWNILGQKGKRNTWKNDTTTRGNKPGGNGERRKIKKISRKDKTIQRNQDIPKQRKKIPLTSKRKYQQPDAREAKQFGVKYGNQENIKKSNGFEERLKAKIYIDSLRTTLKNCQIRKRMAMMVHMDSGSRNSTPSMTD